MCEGDKEKERAESEVEKKNAMGRCGVIESMKMKERDELNEKGVYRVKCGEELVQVLEQLGLLWYICSVCPWYFVLGIFYN